MNNHLKLRLAVFFAGVLLWIVGAATDSELIRWIGIGVMAVSLMLRFLRPPGGGSGEGPPTP